MNIQMNPNKWSNRTKTVWMILLGIASFIYFANRACAEETVSSHIQEAVFDTMSATIAFAGAAQFASTGNFALGTMCFVVGGRELGNACGEIKAAWQIYTSSGNSANDDNRNDRDISPAESCMEHGRD